MPMPHLTRSLAPLVVMLAIVLPVHAQDALLKRADRYHEAFAYSKAIEYYEQAFRRDVNSIPHARRLAECYWNIRDQKGAERWYAVVASSSQAEAEDVYRYAELLLVSGQYADSEIWMKRFRQMAPDDSRWRRKEGVQERLAGLFEQEGITHKVVPVSFNSDHLDMSPFIHGDSLLFASTRPKGNTSHHVDSWNGQPFLNIHIGRLDADRQVYDIAALDDGTNTSYHESNMIVSHDGSELYFMRNNLTEGRRVLGEDGVNNLQIYMRKRTTGGWSKEFAFPYNDPSYSTGHPALSQDGRLLFFTSDRPGGQGGKDLYVCERNASGGWGEPRNLGPDINTEGDEMFPFVHVNTLYFASDGHLGLGGLDLYRATIRPSGFGIVENLGPPVNSTADDHGLCLDEAGDLGFFASDRDGALNADNLYFFRMHSKPDDQRKWAGRVIDINDALPVPHLPVRLLDRERQVLARTLTDAEGRFELHAMHEAAYVNAQIPGGQEVELLVEELDIELFSDTELPDMYLNSVTDLPIHAVVRDGLSGDWLDGVTVTVTELADRSVLFIGTTDEYGVTRGDIPQQRFGDDLLVEVELSKEGYFSRRMEVEYRVLAFFEQALLGESGAGMTPVVNGVDMAVAMELKPIYFDYRSSHIRPDAAMELDRVADVLRGDPTMRIELRSHTDSRASTEYNDALSQSRAASTREYLVKQGIRADRIVARGMGERVPVNRCADGVECSEAEYQANRRTEFIVTGCSDCRTASAGE